MWLSRNVMCVLLLKRICSKKQTLDVWLRIHSVCHGRFEFTQTENNSVNEDTNAVELTSICEPLK